MSPAPRNQLRAATWGAAAIAAYLGAAIVTLGPGRLPLRPFFEGTAPPQPYRWVKPPDGATNAGFDPASGEGTLELGPKGSQAGNISTVDGQALVQFFEGSILARSGETKVDVKVEPVDAATLGEPPPGLAYDSNAYAVTATYAGSGEEAEFAADECPVGQNPKLCPTLVMRYAMGATDLFRRDGDAWVSLGGSTPAQLSLQIFAEVPGAGTFVAAGPPSPGQAGSKLSEYLAIGLGGLAVIIATIAARSKSFRRRFRRRKRTVVTGPLRARTTPRARPKPPVKARGKKKNKKPRRR